MHYRLPRENLEYIVARLSEYGAPRWDTVLWSVPYLMSLRDGMACPFFILDDYSGKHINESLDIIAQWAFSMFGKQDDSADQASNNA